MPFRAHQQTNGKCGGQAVDQLLRAHGAIRRQARRYRKRKACAPRGIAAI
jgi:hypothetical protein